MARTWRRISGPASGSGTWPGAPMGPRPRGVRLGRDRLGVCTGELITVSIGKALPGDAVDPSMEALQKLSALLPSMDRAESQGFAIHGKPRSALRAPSPCF